MSYMIMICYERLCLINVGEIFWFFLPSTDSFYDTLSGETLSGKTIRRTTIAPSNEKFVSFAQRKILPNRNKSV
jgi:hypothetical protein